MSSIDAIIPGVTETRRDVRELLFSSADGYYTYFTSQAYVFYELPGRLTIGLLIWSGSEQNVLFKNIIFL